MTIPVIHHPDYVSLPASGNARVSKNGAVRDLLLAGAVPIDWIVPEPMPRRWIEAVHDPAYVAEVIETRVPPEKERRIGFPVGPAVARRSLRVPGGTWLAALTAIARGYAVNSAGGSHHAQYDSGAGYCVFNDLAIAANRLVGEKIAERVLIVDCDVHQGDGTARLLAGRDDLATYSIHADKNFPARKAVSTLDVPLPDGTGDAAYLDALAATLVPLVERFAPDMLLYQGGVDPFAGDRLGRLALTQGGLDARDRFVAGLARGRNLPLASTLGGGYGHDMGEVAARHVRSITVLAEAYGDG